MSDFDGKTVAVAVSGGVDSLFSLLSLKERHPAARVFALHALFLPARLRGADYSRMLEVLRSDCSLLGVELHVADCSTEFARLVMQPFAEAYFAGRTPNPCAGCNRDVKFGLLWEKARNLGADLLVTGHYARLVLDAQGRAMLLNGLDPGKDQSYFLALTPLERLSRARFPLGNRRKSEIVAELEQRNRDAARSANWGERRPEAGGPSGQAAHQFAGRSRVVEVPVKAESQEICFIPDNDYRAFLADWAARKPELCAGQPKGEGDMLLPDGRTVGRHKGLWSYTEGQRKGLGVAWSEPLFVIGKDLRRNALLLGTAADLNSRSCLCGGLNFLVPPGEWPEVVYTKTRYRQALQPARVEFVDASGQLRTTPGSDPAENPDKLFMRINFIQPAPSAPAAPGQVAAIYAPLPAPFDNEGSSSEAPGSSCADKVTAKVPGAVPDAAIDGSAPACGPESKGDSSGAKNFRLLAGGEIVRG